MDGEKIEIEFKSFGSIRIKQVHLQTHANRCQSSNNYVHDIKNYKIALALVKFLREQLDKLDQNASPVQK